VNNRGLETDGIFYIVGQAYLSLSISICQFHLCFFKTRLFFSNKSV